MEMLTQLLDLLQNDPTAFFTTILSLAGSTTLTGFSAWGLVQLVKTLWGKITKADAKLRKTLSTIVSEKVLPLQNDFTGLKQTIETSFNKVLQEKQEATNRELAELKQQMQELMSQSTALAGTVLNTTELQTQYNNLQNEFLLLKQKTETDFTEAKEEIIEDVEEIQSDIEPVVEDIKKEVKKIRLKRN